MKKLFFLFCVMVAMALSSIAQNCQVISTFPYEESFNSITTLSVAPPCWTCFSTNPPVPVVTNGPMGNSLMFNVSSVGNYAYAVMPKIDTSVILSSLSLNFDIQTFVSGMAVEVGVMTDSSDMNTFQQIASVLTEAPLGPPTYIHYQVYFNSIAYLGTPHFIAFRFVPTTIAGMFWVDNIVLSRLSNCTPPTDLTISNISGSSALVSWTLAQTADSYTVEIIDRQGNIVSSDITTNNQMPVSSLNQQTGYTARVFSTCGDNNSDTVSQYFITTCNQIHESIIGTGTQIMNGQAVPFSGWERSSMTQQIFTPEEVGGEQFINAIALNYYYISTLQVNNFKIYLGTTEDSVFTTGTSWVPSTQFSQVFEGSVEFRSNPPENWFTILFDSTFHYDGVHNLVIAICDSISGTLVMPLPRFYTHPTAGYSSIYVVNTSGNAPSLENPGNGSLVPNRSNIKFIQACYELGCVAPNIMVTGVSDTCANLTIVGNSESLWQIQYKTSAATYWDSVNVTTPSYHFSNLSPNTVYNVRVKALCDNNEESDWAIQTFETTCGVISSLPWNENFSYYSDLNNDFPSCWTIRSNYTGYPILDTVKYHSAPASVHLKSNEYSYNLIALPILSSENTIGSVFLSLQAYFTTPDQFLEIGVMTNPLIDTTFVGIATLSASQLCRWESFDIHYNYYFGEGRYIVIKYDNPNNNASNEMWIDDITVDFIPNCPRPIHVVVSNISDQSALVSWNRINGNSNYSVGIFAAGDQPDATDFVSVNDTSYVLGSLTPDTEYDVYVKTECGANISSAYNIAHLRTHCSPISVVSPYIESFDVYGSGSAILPTCWTSLPLINAHKPYISASTTFNQSAGALTFYTTQNENLFAVMPAFLEPINTLKLNFYAYSNGNNPMLIIGALTDNTDMSSFAPIDTVQITTLQTWENFEIFLSDYTVTANYIAFKTVGIQDINIDSLTVSISNNCHRPSQVVIDNVTENSAIVEWTESGEASSWEIEYGITGFSVGTGTTILTNSNPQTISNLTPATVYDIYVRSACDDTTFSSWSLVENFFTQGCNDSLQCNYYFQLVNSTFNGSNGSIDIVANNIVINTLQLFIGFENFTYSIPLCDGQEISLIWRNNGINDTNNRIIVQNSFNDTIIDITNFQTLIDSTVSFIPNCSPLPEQCLAPTNAQILNITDSSATISWTSSNDESLWKILYSTEESNIFSDSIIVSSPQGTLNQLDPNTAYLINIIALCSDILQSDALITTLTTLPDGIEFFDSDYITVYPNPTRDKFTINSNRQDLIGSKIELYNSFGKLIFAETIHNTSITVDLSRYTEGMYFVKIINKQTIITKKICKQ